MSITDHHPELDVEPVIDLVPEIPYSRERVLEWLRSSGGTLQERMLKVSAAAYLERT